MGHLGRNLGTLSSSFPLLSTPPHYRRQKYESLSGEFSQKRDEAFIPLLCQSFPGRSDFSCLALGLSPAG